MRHLEENTQIDCVTWFRLQYPKLFPFLHHSPNGGKRNAREGARFKAMGTKAGFPDIAIYIPASGYHGLFIEMKTSKGRQTDTQKEWQELLSQQGYKYEVCRGFDEFRHIVNKYLNQYPLYR
ncbi:MAG: VRR-NUC domain-containing protein [Lachnospiraceae bacterium]|nr:VRR-NUC domain-containing protein [Lachnospiraceae bacterium]